MFQFTKKTQSVLEFFLENPEKSIHLRELARILNLSTSTTSRALDALKEKFLISEKPLANLKFFQLNDNQLIKELKKTINLDKIKEEKLIEELKKENPNIISITLFGSFAKGTNNKNSDVDLLIISTKKHIYKKKFFQEQELSILEYSPIEWDKKAKNDKPFADEIKRTSITLEGTKPI